MKQIVKQAFSMWWAYLVALAGALIATPELWPQLAQLAQAMGFEQAAGKWILLGSAVAGVLRNIPQGGLGNNG